MGKKYLFSVATTITGTVVRTVEDWQTPDEVADSLESEAINYDEMASTSSEYKVKLPSVDTECYHVLEVKE